MKIKFTLTHELDVSDFSSCAFIGRTRTATFKLLASALSFNFMLSNDLLTDCLGVSSKTFEKHSGVDFASMEAANRFTYDLGVAPRFLYKEVGVWQAFNEVTDFDLLFVGVLFVDRRSAIEFEFKFDKCLDEDTLLSVRLSLFIVLTLFGVFLDDILEDPEISQH